MTTEALSRFLSLYGRIEPPQDPTEASVDAQFKSLTTVLATKLGDAASVLDIGAGRGALLARLGNVNGFTQSTIEYFAVEEARHHQEIIKIAFESHVHKRVSVLTLEDFYATWPLLPATKPPIVFVRNVFHELNIAQTAALLHHLAQHLPPRSTVLIQDLAVFPVAEKGNACWDSTQLSNVLETLGFECMVVDEATKSGNLWFNLVAIGPATPPRSTEDTHRAVVAARTRQWQSWAALGALTKIALPREERVAKIDFDLQFAALTLQLIDADAPGVEALTRKQEQLAALEAFERALSNVSIASSYDSADVASIRHFKDRRNSQDKLQEFLVGRASAAAIVGPPLMGKSALVQHVLASFAHKRKLIHVDALASWSPWNLLEMIFAACGVRVPQEIIGRLRHIEFATIAEPLRRFAEHVAPRAIVVVDHFERLLGPKDRIDPELRALFSMWGEIGGAKLVFTSRCPLPADLLAAVAIDFDHPPVGRFPHGPHVENVLSTFVSLTANGFPSTFIEAIDRHPYLAELAGRILEREGIRALEDPEFERELKLKLREKLMARAVTETARPAISALMHTRRAVPRKVAEVVAGASAVADALNCGVAYEFTTTAGASLVSCISGFRLGHAEDDDLPRPDPAIRIHQAWASALLGHYNSVDDDPQWLREAFYHTAISGSPQTLRTFGQVHRSELQDAAEYWFRQAKDFHSALWAFEKVAELSHEVDPHVKMRIASCLLRTGKPEEGLKMFNTLFDEYSDWRAVRSSCVDGLLYLSQFAEALRVLSSLAAYSSLSNEQDSWHLGQYGRAFMGLQRFSEAVDAFSRQLKVDNAAVVHRALARAYQRLGLRQKSGRVLELAFRQHPNNAAIVASFGSWLEANGAPDRAIQLLEPRVHADPDNAWLAFPYVCALNALGRVAEARRHLDQFRMGLSPQFMRITVEAQVLKAEGRYEDALRTLDVSSENQQDSDHRIGQRAEILVAWAGKATADAARDIAREGLSELPSDSRNLLINVSILKLCLFACDRQRFDGTLALCKDVNATSEDVARLEKDARSAWPCTR